VKALVEHTNFNIRVGETILPNGKVDFEVSVNCVVADRKTAIVKALSPEKKFTYAHKTAIKKALTDLGFAYDWESKRKELGMSLTKKTHPNNLPHLSDSTSDQERLAGASAWAAEVAAGHYTFVVAEEHAIDAETDLLVVVRKKVK
jgi:hypothetical protein